MPVSHGRARNALLVPMLLLASLAGCQQLTNPGADVELQQSLYDLQDMLLQMRDETALMQSQVDSLQFVVARQDSVLRRLANVIGAPMQ
jgi:hypothetical protein